MIRVCVVSRFPYIFNPAVNKRAVSILADSCAWHVFIQRATNKGNYYYEHKDMQKPKNTHTHTHRHTHTHTHIHTYTQIHSHTNTWQFLSLSDRLPLSLFLSPPLTCWGKILSDRPKLPHASDAIGVCNINSVSEAKMEEMLDRLRHLSRICIFLSYVL